MAKILAINSGLNAAAGYFENGISKFCIQEERLIREKNYSGFPTLALEYIFNNIVKPGEVDRVVFTNAKPEIASKESYYRKYDEAFAAAKKAFGESNFTKKTKKALRETWLFDQIRSRYQVADVDDKSWLISKGIDASKIEYVDHHLCHAAATYYGQAENLEDDYLVFTLDGGGDDLTSTVYHGKSGILTKLSDSDCYSIGNIYSAVTYYLGFKPHEHEYKLMGLSPYVNKDYASSYKAIFDRYVQVKDGRFENPYYLRHSLFMADLMKEFAASRFDNISAGLQMFTEEKMLEWITSNIQLHNINNVLCSGGVFMNVKANQLIANLEEVKTVNVFPSCGDETNIFGGAYHIENKIADDKKVNLLSNFTVGPDPIADLKGSLNKYADRISYETVEDQCKYIAEALADNLIVARCSGPMEFGARALGNRSILANPDSLSNVTKINRAVKKRDFWMPFAPAIKEEDLEDYFVVPNSLKSQKSPYMMFAFDSKEEIQEEIICGLHQADKTGRAQTVNKERYPGLHKVISEFKKLTGNSVILNTSFNLHGYPIVNTTQEAIEVLLNSEIDVLVVENCAIKRV